MSQYVVVAHIGIFLFYMICNQAFLQRMVLWLAFENMSVFDDILSFRGSDMHENNNSLCPV